MPENINADVDNVLEVLEPSLTRLIRQIEQTMASSTLREMGTHVSRVLISGDVTSYNWIVEYLRKQINIPLEMMNPFSTKNKSWTGAVPETDTEAALLAPAIGLALSDPTRTPNFLYTYEQKAAHTQSQKYNKIILAATIVLMLALLGISRLADSLVTRRQEVLAELRKELAERGPGLTPAMLADMAGKASAQQSAAVQTAKRYLGMALIQELCLLTPGNISLNRIHVDMPAKEVDRAGRKNSTVVKIEGLVSGEPGNPESRLAEYSIRLTDSPLIQKANLSRTTQRTASDSNRLPFELTLTTTDLPLSSRDTETAERRTP